MIRAVSPAHCRLLKYLVPQWGAIYDWCRPLGRCVSDAQETVRSAAQVEYDGLPYGCRTSLQTSTAATPRSAMNLSNATGVTAKPESPRSTVNDEFLCLPSVSEKIAQMARQMRSTPSRVQ